MNKRPRPIMSLDVGAWLRSLRQWPGLTLTVLCAAVLASAFLGVAPRVLEHASEEDLREAIASSTPEQRNIRFETRTRIGAGSNVEPFNYVNRRGDALFDDNVPEAISAIVSDRQFVFDSPRFSVTSFPDEVAGPFPTTFAFRYQEGVEDQLVLIEGELPRAREPIKMFRGTECPELSGPEEADALSEFEPLDDVDCRVDRLPVFEAAVTATTADDMMVSVGDSVTLTPDGLDSRWLQANPEQLDDRFVLTISGIIELSDPTLDFWYADTRLHRPRVTENPDFRLVAAVGLMRSDRYRQLLREVRNVPNSYTWRYLVDPDEITGAQAGDLSIEIEKIAPTGVQTVTQLPRVIAEHLEQRSVTVSLLSTATAALLIAAVATTLVLALLIAERHHRATALIIDRGASVPQVLINGARSSSTVIVPASIAGWSAGRLWLPNTASTTPTLFVASFSALAVAVSIAATRWVGSADPDERLAARRGPSTKRLVFEGLVMVLAAGSIVLLRRRGMTLERNRLADFDALLAVAPALVAVAIGVVVLRLLGPIMHTLARSAATFRGLVAFLGARRVTMQPSVTRFPVVVIVLAVSAAVFSAAVGTSLSAAQRDASWQIIGADYRIETVNQGVPVRLPQDQSLLSLGPTVAAGRLLAESAIITPGATTRVDVTALDLETYGSFVDERGIGVASLAPLFDNGAAGTADDPIPAIVSDRWPAARPLGVGDQFTIGLGPVDPIYVVREVAARFPGIDDRFPFILIDRPTLERVAGSRIAQPTFVLGVGQVEDRANVVEAAAAELPFTIVSSRYDELAEIVGDPFAYWIDRVLRWLFVVSVAFAIVAAVSALAIAAATRRRDVGLLATLGMTPRQAAVLTAIEQLPVVTLGTTAGAVSGVAAVRLLDPALRIGLLAGGSGDVGVAIDPWATLLIGLTLAVILAGAVGISMVAQRRVDSARILRVGDE